MPARVIVAQRAAYALKAINEQADKISEIAGVDRLSVPMFPRDKELERTLQLEALAVWLTNVAAHVTSAPKQNDEEDETQKAKRRTRKK